MSKDTTHIYDWLELPANNDAEIKVKEVLDFRTRAAYYQMKNTPPPYKIFCEYKGQKYRITGASRMGDVWLAEDFDREMGYDHRVAIDDCSNFSYEKIEDARD